MALCVVAAGVPLLLLSWGTIGGGLTGVWLSLLLFQSLRALGFAYRFWIDRRAPLSKHNPTHGALPGAQGQGKGGGRGMRGVIGWILWGRRGGEEEGQVRDRRRQEAQELWYF